MNIGAPLAEECLCAAVKCADIETAEGLLRAGVAAGCLYNSPINIACKNGQKRMMTLLLDWGANPFDCSGDLVIRDSCDAATFWAAERDAITGRHELLPMLIARKPCPPDALQRALQGLAFGGDPHAVHPIGCRLIDDCVRRHGADPILPGVHPWWIEYLIRHHHANPASRGLWNNNALEEAVKYLDVEAVIKLLEHGADPNGVPKDHLYLADPDHAQVPHAAWQILRLLVNAPNSTWTFSAEQLADRL